MKDKLLLALYVVILGSVVYFCTRKKTPVKKVAIREVVLDSIYSKNKSFLTSFSNKLENIDVIKNFKNLTVKSMNNDSEEEITDLSISLLADSTFLDKGYKFSTKSNAIISRLSNLNFSYGVVSDSVIASKKYPFSLDILQDSDLSYTQDNTIWEYHLNNHYQTDLKDSIYAYEKDEIIKDADQYLKQIKEAKYLIVITDLYYIKPKMMSTSKGFESGMLITKVDVYNAKDEKKIGHKVFLTSNSDKVNVLPAINNPEIQEKLYYQQLEMDLARNRSKKIMSFLERQKTKATY